MISIPFPYSKVSITGGTGTVASVLQQVIVHQCPVVQEIHASCRNPEGSAKHRLVASQKIKIHEGSIQELDVLKELVDAGEVVFHLAAWLANTDMPKDWNTIYITNSLATAVLCRLCQAKGRKLVFTSSHSVYFAGKYTGHINEDSYAFRQDFIGWINSVKQPYYDLADAIIAGEVDMAASSPEIEAIHSKLPPPMKPLIYENPMYHLYCLSKLLAESFVLDHEGVVLRLANLYGPGDESLQAVGEACHRVMNADPKVEISINQPFKKLVPAYLGDVVKALLNAARFDIPKDISHVFTVASQENYLREDTLLSSVASSLNRVQGTNQKFMIEALPDEDGCAFTYDLSKTLNYLIPDESLTTLEDGLAAQLQWRINRAAGFLGDSPALTVSFADAEACANI